MKWDYEAFNPLIPPKQKTWPNQVLFNLLPDSLWGHERLMWPGVVHLHLSNRGWDLFG